MKTHLIITAAAVLSLSLGMAGVAGAQVSSSGGPYMVSADTWHADGTAHVQYYDGRVEIIQNDSRLRADHIKVTHSSVTQSGGDGWGDVVTIEATGNVYYVTPDQKMKGDSAVYTKAADTMVITGGVVLQQGQNVMTGQRLTTIVSTGTSTFDSPGGRVKAVIYPDSKSANAAADKTAGH